MEVDALVCAGGQSVLDRTTRTLSTSVPCPLCECRLGISGVPYFIVSCGDSKRYALSGAQPARAFAGAFEKALAEAGPR